MKKMSLSQGAKFLKRSELREIFGGYEYGSKCISCNRGSDCGSTVCAINQPNCPSGKYCL